jgi:hypothetical protein
VGAARRAGTRAEQAHLAAAADAALERGRMVRVHGDECRHRRLAALVEPGQRFGRQVLEFVGRIGNGRHAAILGRACRRPHRP